MKRPKWMIIIGVLTIIFGLWGIVNQLATIGSSSYYLSMESEMETESRVSGEQVPDANSTPQIIEDTQRNTLTQEEETVQSDKNLESFQLKFNEYLSLAMVIGVLSLLISGAYALAGLFLMTKSYGIHIFYYAMVASILWAVAQTMLISQSQLEMFVLFIAMKVPSIVIDVILVTAVLLGTRYQPPGTTVATDRKLLADAAVIFSKPVNVGVPVMTGAFAALCVLVIPFWIMGVPGAENNFARGWNIGLDVIMYYPLAWMLVYGLFQLLKKYLPSTRHSSVAFGVSVCLSLFLGMAIFRLIQAFSIMAT